MQVKTLGGLDAGIKPMKPKNLLLLCYLALEGKQDRKHLQMLFWPEAADPATSLRVALSYLQSLEKDLFRSVQNQVEALIHTDAQHLMQAHQQNQHSEVIGLYAGSFLKGLDLRNTSTELEDWIFETREKLASLVQWSILKEAQKVRFSAAEQFQPLMEKFFQVEGAPPPTLEMLRFMYSLGLEGYLEHRVLKEAAELGVDLTTLQVPQKTNLQSAIRPVQVFVGREQEMQLLHERLQQNPPGIVSVTGLGGVGKSTLVRMYCATHHPENTLWLKADGLKDASGLLHQLGLNVQQADPWVGLSDTLRHHKGLVVIDGADQLSGLDHLQHWLRFPDLRVLVTCRQPLQLPEESLLKLEPFSIQEYRGMGLSEVLGHPAVQCFEKHAKRHHAAFKIQPEDAQDALHLCAALSGLPLALEMASSWTQILSLKEIKQEVQQVVDPEGDPQSLKPIFEASWNLLSDQEKQALINLNCFLGSFTREAAVMVSGVQLRTLQQLVRKSMLQLEPSQRFRVPPVLKGFIPDFPTEVMHKHQEYHLHLLNTMEVRPGQGLLEYAGAIPDLMAVLRATWKSVDVKSFPLLRLFESSGLKSFGLQFYSDVIKNLAVEDNFDLFIEYAWLCLWMGHPHQCFRICNQIKKLTKNPEHLMKVHNMSGIYYAGMGEYEIAQASFEKALSMSESQELKYIQYGINLIMAYIENGEHEKINLLLSSLKLAVSKIGDDFYNCYLIYLEILIDMEVFKYEKFDRIEVLIKTCEENMYGELEIYALIMKIEIKIQKRDLENLEKDILKAKNKSWINQGRTVENKLDLLEIIWLFLTSDSLHVKKVEDLLGKIKASRDRKNLLDLFEFLLPLAGIQGQLYLQKIQSCSQVSANHQYRLQLAAEKMQRPGTGAAEVVALLKPICNLLEWLTLTDHHMDGEEDLLHPHPEAPETPHPPEPHPRGPERSL